MLKYLFESLLPLVADSVLALRCYAPSALLVSLQIWVSRLRAVPFLAFLLLISFIFLLFLPFSAFDSDVVCFILSVFLLWRCWCCLLGYGFCYDSFIQHMIRIYLIRTYDDVTVFFLSGIPVYDYFQLLQVYVSSVFVCFPPEEIFHYWSLSGDQVNTESIVVTMSQ